MRDEQGSGWFAEEAARDILRRAMEIDQRRTDGVSADDLLHIAQELEISPASLKQALAEVSRPAQTAAPQQHAAALPTWRPFHSMPLVTAAVATVLPVVVHSITPLVARTFILEPTIATMFAVQAMIIGLGTLYEGEAPQQRWHLANLTTWFGFAAGFVLIGERATSEFWPILTGFALMSALAGSALLAVRAALRHKTDASASNTGDGPGTDASWKARMRRRISRFIDVVRNALRTVPGFNHVYPAATEFR